MGFPTAHLNPYDADLDAIDTTGDATLGGLYVHQGELFRFVYNDTAATDGTGGLTCAWSDGDTYGYVASLAADVVAEALVGAKAVGMWCTTSQNATAVQFGNYGFVKVVGDGTNGAGTTIHQTDDSQVAGAPLVIAGTTTPTFIGHLAEATEEHLVYAWGVEDDSGSDPYYGNAALNCL